MEAMTQLDEMPGSLRELDEATRLLVRVAAAAAASDEGTVRRMLADAAGRAPDAWVEEAVLQTYLFAGFPRCLNAMREWRRLRPEVATPAAPLPESAWRSAGEATCAAVYDGMYERLRENVRALHPALDDWMIVEGYGKVLSRPGLDLGRRELCVVAACAASGQDRQLHSHLHGARNVGVDDNVVRAALDALADLMDGGRLQAARLLFARVVGK